MKNIILLTFTSLVILSCSSSKQTDQVSSYIFDNEEVLSALQEVELNELFRAHEVQTSNQVVLLTTSDFGADPDIETFAMNYGNRLGIGQADKDNGVLIVFSKAMRQTMISTGLGTQKVLTDEIASQFVDELMIPKFRDSLYFEGIQAASWAIVEFLERAGNEIR